MANDLGRSLRSVLWLNLLIGMLMPVAAMLFPREGSLKRWQRADDCGRVGRGPRG